MENKQTTPKEYAKLLFSRTKKIFTEFHLSQKDLPLTIMNVSILALLSSLLPLLKVLIEEKNFGLLDEIIKEYQQLLKRGFPSEEVAYVKTAIPLTEEEKADLNDRLASIFGKYYRLEIEVEPDLIAGLVVQIEDKVLDESVLGKIEELGRRLNL